MSDQARPPAPPSVHRPSLVVAGLLLGAALQIGNGFYTPLALALSVAAIGLTWVSLLAPRALGAVVPDRDAVVAALLFAGVQAQIVAVILSPLGLYFVVSPSPAAQPGFIPALLLCSVALGVAAAGGPRLRRAAALVLLAAVAFLGLRVYQGSPRPHIDVVTVHEGAYQALSTGSSPYSITFPDIYQGKEDFYPDDAVKDGVVHYGFPYPPLSLAMTWPGFRLGDLRYSELVAWVGAGAAIVASGAASTVAVLAAGLVLLTPRAFFGLEQAWTDPLAALWLCGAIWAAGRGRLTAAAVLVGLAAATKQYVVLAVPLLVLLAPGNPRLALRLVLTAAGAAAATLLPALLDPAGAWGSIVMVQVREELRLDALSLAVPFFERTGRPLPGLAYGLIVVAATGLAAWRAAPTPAGFAAAVTVALGTTFLFGKKAFCNYYLFVLVALAATLAARDPQRDGRPLTPA